MGFEAMLKAWAAGAPSFGNDFHALGLAETLILDRHERGLAVLTWRPDQRYCHLAGAVTGGYVCVVADWAANAAMMTVLAGDDIHVTPDLRMSWFRPFTPGVYALEARVISVSKSAATVEVAFIDDKGRLAGKATVNEAIRSRDAIGFKAP
jgi:uncharacterized protein (TIGR00369 family)